MLTKKDYKVLAIWWRHCYLRGDRLNFARDMAENMLWLSKNNPNFDHLKFIKAVYLGE